ncbi:TetR family transcriptional regulator [Gemmobacter serpentinus]|uniref:TetR family transcriptional regulator n=1 Tax=Gemmobacter serpentinus TaxID=2652247 RepID=UPI00124C4F01|nr:TetR family transcriptional regulator [Gemmobacter serpentinus]
MAYMARDERRGQIMNAVVEIVARERLAAATVRRIAQALDCSPGQIHHHFSSADALRAEAVREVWCRLEPQFVALLHRLPPRERLVTMLSGCCSAFADEIGPVMLVAERLWKEAWDIRREPAVRESIAEGIGKMRDEIIQTLQDGMHAGIFPADMDVSRLSLVLIAATQGYDLLAEIGAAGELGTDKAAYVEELLRKEGL